MEATRLIVITRTSFIFRTTFARKAFLHGLFMSAWARILPMPLAFLFGSRLAGCRPISLPQLLSSNTWQNPFRWLILFSVSPASPPSFARSAPGFPPALVFRLYVHGQLLVSFCRRSCLFCGGTISDGNGRAIRPLVPASFAVALIGMITPFHLYLCALFLTLYVPVRLFGQYGWQPRLFYASVFARRDCHSRGWPRRINYSAVFPCCSEQPPRFRDDLCRCGVKFLSLVWLRVAAPLFHRAFETLWKRHFGHGKRISADGKTISKRRSPIAGCFVSSFFPRH